MQTHLQVVEEFEVAVEHGLPADMVPEPCTWLEDIQGRLNAARRVEADRRTEQQVNMVAEGHDSSGCLTRGIIFVVDRKSYINRYVISYQFHIYFVKLLLRRVFDKP